MLLFSLIKKDSIAKNAQVHTSAATASILQKVVNVQGRMEEIALSLASVVKGNVNNSQTIQSLISVDKLQKIVSAGVWFEPYAKLKKEKDHFHFFNKSKDGVFHEVSKGLDYKYYSYREMDFYREAKALKEGEIFWTEAYTDRLTRRRMTTVVTPIILENKFIGVASVDIEINSKENMFLQKDFSATEHYLLMIDRDGTLLGRSSLFAGLLEKETNIYSINSPEMLLLLEEVKPMLNPCKTQVCQEEVREKGFNSELRFVENDPILGFNSVIATYHFPSSGWRVIVGMSEDKILTQANKTYKNLMISILVLTLLATVFGFILLRKIFIKPLANINEQLNKNVADPSKHYSPLHCEDKGEIGVLVHNLNIRTAALEDSLEREATEAQRRKLNDKLLEQQSKMAAMGEMMDAVAHQWKQPLNALTMYSDIIKSDFDEGTVDKKYIGEYSKDLQVQIDHMVSTLDEFRRFFRPNEKEEDFDLLTIINSVLFLTKDEFLKHRIIVSVEEDKKMMLHGSANEFKHLILNLINNAKDAFGDDTSKKRKITLRLREQKGKNILEIADNAGGVPKQIIADIFKANVTTKGKGKGTGIGLYMSTKIAKKYNADLTVHNTKDGACFVVTFNGRAK